MLLESSKRRSGTELSNVLVWFNDNLFLNLFDNTEKVNPSKIPLNTQKKLHRCIQQSLTPSYRQSPNRDDSEDFLPLSPKLLYEIHLGGDGFHGKLTGANKVRGKDSGNRMEKRSGSLRPLLLDVSVDFKLVAYKITIN